jgi:nucleotide sugar dehydrogenase
MDLCIIGSGYVGLVTGACFAEVGHHVICVDNDQRKVDMLQAGKIPIYEPGLEDLVHRNVGAKRLRFTTSTQEGVDASQVVFIAVPTPPQPDGSVDMTFIEKVAREISAALKPGQYRVSLLRTFKDGFYPGIHQLPDGTIVATTYANYRQEDVGCSIVSIRFKMDEVDALAAKAPSEAKR